MIKKEIQLRHEEREKKRIEEHQKQIDQQLSVMKRISQELKYKQEMQRVRDDPATYLQEKLLEKIKHLDMTQNQEKQAQQALREYIEQRESLRRGRLRK